MSTAQVQGSLWGARAREYAGVVEPFVRPLYEAVFDVADVEAGTRLLDVGCGPGLAAQLAAQRGGLVSGLDAAEASLEIARERTPQGNFRAGEMEDLPWPDNSFDVVTGFNSFQYAAELVNALREARRVARPGGRVAMAVWGRQEDCETVEAGDAEATAAPIGPPLLIDLLDEAHEDRVCGRRRETGGERTELAPLPGVRVQQLPPGAGPPEDAAALARRPAREDRGAAAAVVRDPWVGEELRPHVQPPPRPGPPSA